MATGKQDQETIVAIAEWVESNLTAGELRNSYQWQASKPTINKSALDSLITSHLISSLSASADHEVVELMHDRWVTIAREERIRRHATPPGSWNFESEESVKGFIDKIAYFVSRSQKREKIAELYQNPDNFHDERIDRESHDIGEDHFCLEVLEGRASLAVLPSNCYGYLLNSSLEDAKKLKAYYIAELQQTPDMNGLASYYAACKLLRSRAMDQKAKLPAVDFHPVNQYIKDKKLDGDFYLNINSAVINGDQESYQKLRDALGITLESEKPKNSVNCFQAAIVMYFLNPTLVETYNLQCIF